MKIVSWNVNGLRAVLQRGDLAWAFDGDLDVVGLQETKIQMAQVTDEMRAPPGYSFSTWAFHGTKKGYSGTALFVRDGWEAKPFPFLIGGAEHPEFDAEGRITGVDLGPVVVLNVYFPNGGSSAERLAFKHRFHEAFLAKLFELAQTRQVVVCGDFNIAHRPIDVALPQEWSQQSGFLPEERAWFDRLLAAGFLDTFRAEKGDLSRQFTFWETRLNARADNTGWRIDYHVASKGLEEHLLDAWISPQVRGSDHCPVGVELDLLAPKAKTGSRASAAGATVLQDSHERTDESLDEAEVPGEAAVEDDDDDDGRARWRR
jgi:exodeoxyribonuclease-3